MKNKINNQLAHQFLIADFAWRTLERDLKLMKDLKTAPILTKLYEVILQEVNADLKEIQAQMKREKLRFVGERKVSEGFTGFEFNQGGLTEELRYANYALRNHTLSAIEHKIQNKK